MDKTTKFRRCKVEDKLYFLKYEEQYIRSNRGIGSIHLTNRLADADLFSSQESAEIFVCSLMVNSKGYMVDSEINLNNVKIVQ